jgi:organic radical activating enzyme
MLDIRKIKNGYWWNAQEKYDALINGDNSLQEMTIQITDRCNMNCPKCNKTNWSYQDMETMKVLEIIEEACDLGLQHIHFTGGEATLHQDFPAMIKHCKNHNLRVDMSTNGKFTCKKALEMYEAGLDSINISWDFINQPPECISFIDGFGFNVFLNHMVMPGNYFELPNFLNHIKNNYPFIIDIQLMPPRGTADKFTDKQIKEFLEFEVEYCYEVSKDRFPMVQNKIMDILTDGIPERGIYHQPINWECHRAKKELRVGSKGFTTCTYLYRDGHVACGLDKSVEEAWNICKDFCSKKNPPLETCDYSCSPEVAYFNYFVENKL